MHKEVAKNEASAVLVILASVGGVFILAGLLDMLVKLPLLHDILMIAAVGSWVLYLIRHYLCSYEYSLIDRELIFHRQLAGRETLMLNVSIDDLECILPHGAPELGGYRCNRTFSMCVTARRHNRYVGVFRRGGTYCRFVFQPTEKLVELIREEQNR